MRMKYVRLAAVLAAAFLAFAGPVAQCEDYIEDDLQNWNTVTLTSPLSPDDKVLGYLEVQPRLGNDMHDLTALIIRPALGYQVHKNVSLWQGYAWNPTNFPQFRDEHRIYQQMTVDNTFKRFRLINRTRLEERFIEDTDGTSVRGRHMVRVQIPFGKNKKWAWVVSDEFFVNFNSVAHGPRQGFDQNRVFAGINRTFNKHANAEVGYLGNHVNRRNAPDRWNHVIVATINLRVK